MPTYNLADIYVHIDENIWTLPQSFNDFLTGVYLDGVNWNIKFDAIPEMNEAGSDEGTVLKCFTDKNNKTYLRIPKENEVVSLITAESDWKNSTFYLNRKFNFPDDNNCRQWVETLIIPALKEAFSAILALNGGLHLHAATIEWEGKGIAYSAPSGTGKTTQAHLWRELYDIRILDGDVAACRIKDGGVKVYGLPWCGTSEEYINGSAPLKAIVFLEQAEENRIERLKPSEAFMRLIAGSFLPIWSEALVNKSIDTAQIISETVDCYLLHCRPDQEAVELVRQCVK